VRQVKISRFNFINDTDLFFLNPQSAKADSSFSLHTSGQAKGAQKESIFVIQSLGV
jgi:hypothetical protein